MDKITRITLIGIKKITLYREYFAISILKNIVYVFIQYTLWLNILASQHQSEKLSNIITYFLINQIILSFYPNVSGIISDEIREGTIIHRLCKPISLEVQYFFESVGASIAKFAVLGFLNIILIVVFSKQFFPQYLVQLILLIFIGYLLHFVLNLLFGSLAFFTQTIWGIESLKEALMTIFSGAIFPLSYYPEWSKRIIDLFPFSYTMGKISEFYISGMYFKDIVIVQLIYIVIIYIIYKMVIKFGLKKIIINGG